jgi:hypothetical protein
MYKKVVVGFYLTIIYMANNFKGIFSAAGEMVKPFAGIITFGITLFSCYMGYQKFFEDRPHLLVEVESFELKGFSNASTILEKLTNIEQNYGEVTAGKILTLKKSVEILNEFDTASVNDLLRSVYTEINEFQQEISPWEEKDIVIYEGKVRWPDNTEFDIVNDKNAENIFPAQCIIVKNNPRNIDEAVKKEIRHIAFALYKPFGNDARGKRMHVAQDLREVRVILEKILNVKNHFAEIKVNVINRSRQPNLVRKRNEIVMGSSAGKIAIPVTLATESVIPGIGFNTLILKTADFGKLSKEQHGQIVKLLNDSCHLTIGLNDLYGGTWQGNILYKTGLIAPTQETPQAIASF